MSFEKEDQPKGYEMFSRWDYFKTIWGGNTNEVYKRGDRGCKGLCLNPKHNFKHTARPLWKSQDGQRWCRACEYSTVTDKKTCFCCGTSFRSKRRRRYSRAERVKRGL